MHAPDRLDASHSHWTAAAPRSARPDHTTLPYAMARLAATEDARFPSGFAALVAALEYAFRQEEELMDDLGLALPEHREQHAALLTALQRCEQRVAGGDIAAGRAVLRLACAWFTLHRESMDAAVDDALLPEPFGPVSAAGGAASSCLPPGPV